MPLAQLVELISHLTGANQQEIQIPKRFSFKQPYKIMAPRTSFYNSLTKIAPFETLDVLCLTRDEVLLKKPDFQSGVVPPKDLVRTLFTTYSQVFHVNQTEHTILYYLY